MRKLRLYQTVTRAAVVTVLASGLGVGVVRAQGSDTGLAADSPEVAAVPPAPVDQEPGVLQEFVRRLAQHLGVSEDLVREALRQTVGEMGPELRSVILRLQLSQMGEGPLRGSMGPLGPLGFPLGGPGPQGPARAMQVVAGITADVLEMSPQDLRGELQNGKSLADIGQEHGLSPDELTDQVIARAEELRQQRVHNQLRGFLEQPLPGMPGR